MKQLRGKEYGRKQEKGSKLLKSRGSNLLSKENKLVGGKKRQPRRGLIDEEKASEEDTNCTTPQPTQENQSEFHVASSSYVPVAEDDDEVLRLRPRTILEEAYLTRSRKRQNPQEPIESRVIGFKGDKSGVSEPTNLPIAPNGLTWNGKDAITTN
ncbi:hypothetical protein KY290_007804 [Solanum tuberosum]|uniref:Uncharacterized protein n=1 Tax=Solanum tuberosum TaxID=4113 RepID=A0ABQ7W6L6_SOLTU|nr:hypothetical protein KY290_007804 [Solanum tuberosum]